SSTTARRNPCIVLSLPIGGLLLSRDRKAASPFWFIPSHGQVFLLGLEYLLQALRLKTVYTLWTLPCPACAPGLGVPLLIGGLASHTRRAI
ncbi:MAG: hypothetical protein K2P65_00480, partial [Lachnospiraceae bacterium]|nr:hypothetical protein [Lachnospiraceae bacterium]